MRQQPRKQFLLLLTLARCWSTVHAFSLPPQRTCLLNGVRTTAPFLFRHHHHPATIQTNAMPWKDSRLSSCRLLQLGAQSSENEIDETVTATPALPASSSSSSSAPQIKESGASDIPKEEDDDDILLQAKKSATVAMMISLENKRILVEELGYPRKEVEQLKFELAPIIVQRRLRYPVAGVPSTWCRSKEELEREKAMMETARKIDEEEKALLEQQESSKCPVKVPLKVLCVVLFGIGVSGILVNLMVPPLTAEKIFGLPVLWIDAACLLVGSVLLLWTFSVGWWTTSTSTKNDDNMNDENE